MGVNFATSSEYEAEANRLRSEIGATIGALRTSLTPSNLMSEAAARAGVADMSWAGAFDYASKRHPIPTAVIGLGLALLTMSAIRKRATRGNVAALTTSLRESSDSLFETASQAFRERAELKRKEFLDVARTQVATGAAMLSDEIEKGLEGVMGHAPGGPKVRSLIESSIQLALAAALEGLFAARMTPRPSQHGDQEL
ncbi:hypothetical protein [Rhodoblastus sp.]|uniref:hypothetical protein n=1 Tax=Rhodoblastus sp. TaxID=1962975 RepID=UPI0025D10ACE|nr:hypothetical protein [Rhodoblastus sp.]